MILYGKKFFISLVYALAVVRGVARIFEWGDERRRREKRGAEGAEEVGCGEGSGEGLCPSPENF